MLYTEIIIDQHYGGLNPVQFGYENCKPAYSYGPAVRTHWLLHYVVSGFGIFEYEGITHKIGPGKIFVIPPYARTYYEADTAKPWKYIWIGFTTNEELPEIFRNPVINCPEAGEIFKEMKQSKNLSNGRSAFLSSCLWKLIGKLLEEKKPIHDFIEQAINYIHAEYANHISVQELAQRLHVDRCHFSTAFTKRIGCSPQEYLINLRLTKAAELMVTHQKSPSTAALSVGYADLYQFSKIFKKHFGVSPRAYVEQNTP